MSYTPNKADFQTKKMLAQITPAAKNVAENIYSPGTNEEVSIDTIIIANYNNKDIDFIVYVDDDGTTYDDSTTVVADKVKKEESGLGSERVIYMNDSNGSIGFESSDTDVTITIWGTVTDLS